MARRVLREMFLFVAVLAIMALMLHPDLLIAPAERYERMHASGSYLHPLLYAGGIYLLLSLLRGIRYLLSSFFTKNG